MDVVRLDKATYVPDSLVEDYSSMIWTERYLDNGEFQLTTPEVEKTRALIPVGSLISLMDSLEVQIVENHSIKRDDKGAPTLTVTGRTFDTFLEQRVMMGEYQQSWPMLKQYRCSEIAAYLLWNYLVNTTGQDPSRDDQLTWIYDAIANLVVTNSTTFPQTYLDWTLQAGVVYPQLRDFLSLGGLGYRSIRPDKTSGYVTTFDTSTSGARGNIAATWTTNLAQMRLDIYNGTNRSRNQSVVEPVIFHYDSGHIDNPEYLFTNKELKNEALVSSSLGNMSVWPGLGLTHPAPIPSGLNRRVLFIDGGKMESGEDEDVFQASLVQKGLIELSKHNRSALFDGAVSALSPYEYNKEYFLGDLVTLLGEYGLETSMAVSEYVRTEDAEGDRGYPTLILSS